jgi:malonyl-CoA O-methyltransferase
MTSPTERLVDATVLRRVATRLARCDGAPWLHGEVAHRMAERLRIVRLVPRRVLEWWAHAGGSHDVLQRVYPDAAIVAVEAAMAAVRPRAPWWSAQRWRAPTEVILESTVPADDAELVWANMMLHAVSDPGALMQRWRAALRVEGFLMFSTLGPDTLRPLRDLYRDAGWGPPHAPFTDMHDLGDMLVAAGFVDPVMDQERLTLTWATPQAVLAELHGLGSNAEPGRHAGLRTPRWRQRLEAALAERADSAGRIGLEFEIVYGHAFKPEPSARMAGETRVEVDDLRRMARAGRRRESLG